MSNSDVNPGPFYTLLMCLALVAASTFAFPYVTVHGTQLFQAVGLLAWALVASATSDVFAHKNPFVLWPLAGLLSVVAYSLLAVPLYYLLRRSAPVGASVLLVAWLFFYVACLFVLFPAN